MIIYSLIIIIIILLVLLCIIGYKYIRCKDDLYAQNDMYTYYKNKVSMIEYHYRNYREGENAFTVLRKIGDVIQDYYSKMGNGGTTDG